ncbi:tail fiber protein [Moraxella nasibovis]|uniref:phage tail protein n=1 Tax=Moraxella nasibovis TaxID=2904120 RepID=UPI00240FD558|nr:phage tail protein [Moraxella nasibovis]WFF39607.1 tail fiber protein [Moraxella nasibovis]
MASSVQAINANLANLSTNKADKTLNLVAGNGLTGGGTLQASRTVALGTPSQITASTTNSVTATSHTHAIDKASTTVAGVVQLNDTLTSTATNQALTAAQGKVLKDGLDGLTTSKADKTTNLTAGNGLTGGGNLSASRTVALGTPSQITATSTNGVTATSHTHAIDKASTTRQGVVQLNDTLASTAADQALTTNQSKVLNDKIDNKDSLKTINYLDDKSSNYQLTGFYRGNSQPIDGINTSSLEIYITHPSFPGNVYARGIGFDYGSSFDLYSHAWSPQGVHLGRKKILTEENGVQKSGDVMTGVLTLNNQRWPRVVLASSNGPQALLLESGGTDGTHCLAVRPHESGEAVGSNIARFNLPTVTGTKTIAVEDGNIATATKLQTARTINGVAFDGTQNITIHDNTKLASNANAVSASRLATARTISLTGAVTGSVRFDGSANVSIDTADDNSIGLVAFFAMTSAPNGWLKANGAAVSRTTYAKLFAKIGTTFGAGDGRTTFNLPDLRGEFIRGFDDARGIDTERTFGSMQSDAIRNITGSMSFIEMMSNDAATGVFSKTNVSYAPRSYRNSGGGNHYTMEFNAATQVPTANENRPRNIALLACIKF